jgi:RHS repeat-associated protein
VSFTSATQSICTATGTNGATITLVAAGTCTLNANQAGDVNYNAAPQVARSFAVAAGGQVYFIHADHLGTPRVITKSTDNSKVWEWGNAEPFGDNAPNEDPNATGTAFKFNLRFPGQYFDQETGTHYNYYRDYEPATGRYVQSDPIGLRGGLNTYVYVGGAPLAFTDPSGLVTYQCKRPLGDKPGNNQRNGPDIWGNPLYHQYSCVKTKDGKTVCGGQGFGGNGSKWVPDWATSQGKPTPPEKDYFDEKSCEKTQDDNKCFEDCLQREWAKPRPRYGVPFGTDCQEYDDDVNQRCRKECKLK